MYNDRTLLMYGKYSSVYLVADERIETSVVDMSTLYKHRVQQFYCEHRELSTILRW